MTTTQLINTISYRLQVSHALNVQTPESASISHSSSASKQKKAEMKNNKTQESNLTSFAYSFPGTKTWIVNFSSTASWPPGTLLSCGISETRCASKTLAPTPRYVS